MQCLAGLWWDQQRRICVLPSEVACNPYNIINSQGQGPPIIDVNPNSKISFLFVCNKYLYLVLQPPAGQPQAPPPPPAIGTTPINSFPQAPIQPGSGINIKIKVIE
jgi:hypothetical protein